MEDCRYFEELIGAELDGELTADQAEALHAHLETCETCRAYREALGILAGTAADLPAPPAELTGRIMDAVRREAAAKKKAKVVPLARYLRPAALAAAAALVIWAGWRVVGPKGSAKTAAAPMAPMAAVSMAAAEDAAPEEAPAETESFAVAEAAPLPEPAALPAAGAEPETDRGAENAENDAFLAEDREEERASGAPAFGETPMMAAAAAAERPSRYVLCRGETGEPIHEGELDAGALGALLAADPTARVPDRAADYALRLPDAGESWLLWEEDGAVILRGEDAEGPGWTVSAEDLRPILGIGE